MTEFTRELMYGKRPVRRTAPKPGQSEWYYLDPRGASTFSDMKQIDVPSENSPNPYANEIQNYLYKNDEYNYKQLYGNTPPPPVQTQNNNDPNCYMTFNGQNLNLYNNIGQVGSLDAQSGHDDFQSSQYQNVENKGPIPEGTYYANQDQRQSLTPQNIALKLGEKLGLDMQQKSGWSGNPISWGISRVWLQPDANTNTYGRSGFTTHGGLAKGSRGCIDIPWQTGKLNNYLDECQDSVPVYVKYPKKW
ncbi:MAG: DUF2778 domain-containing protein [Alphaproteobacteria bacterium]|nr:DUF2778 domain-containing protein [Alphaproteobacteria bacterium]